MFFGRVKDACVTSQHPYHRTCTTPPTTTQTHHKLTTNSPQTHRHCTLHHKRYILQVRSRSQLHDRVCQVLFSAPFERGLALSLLMDCGRFTGAVDELAEVLRRCVNHGGRSFVRYSEEASVHVSNLDMTAINEQHFVLLQFHMISEQLMFNRSLTDAALRIVGREN